jgi:hypothetical protein
VSSNLIQQNETVRLDVSDEADFLKWKERNDIAEFLKYKEWKRVRKIKLAQYLVINTFDVPTVKRVPSGCEIAKVQHQFEFLSKVGVGPTYLAAYKCCTCGYLYMGSGKEMTQEQLAINNRGYDPPLTKFMKSTEYKPTFVFAKTSPKSVNSRRLVSPYSIRRD